MYSKLCSCHFGGWRTVAVSAAVATAMMLSSVLGVVALPKTPDLVPFECNFDDLPVRVSCATFNVPERRDVSNAREIQLVVMELKSRQESSLPPVLFLEGGPGVAGSDSLEQLANLPLLDNRDVIVVDQRGTGLSTPNLTCPEMEEAYITAFTPSGLTGTGEIQLVRDAASACRTRLMESGVDLNGYDSQETGFDMKELREALGFPQWDVYGVSYGTRAAVATLNIDDHGVRGLVLDSGAPVDEFETRPSNLGSDISIGIDHFLAACASDPACTDAYPALAKDFEATIARFNEAPYRTSGEVSTRDGAREIEIEITGDDLYAFAGLMLKEEDLIPEVPLIVTALAQGSTEPFDALIVPLLLNGVLAPGGSALGTQLSVDCADQPPVFDAADRELLANPGRNATLLMFGSGTFCDVWNVEPAALSDIDSDVPVLLIAGAFDPISLPAQTRSMMTGFSRATYVELPASGHVPSFSNACTASLVNAFLADLGSTLDVTCAQQERGPAFTTATE